jgi:protocatechuate 3,4-dioxygenase beta subunit
MKSHSRRPSRPPRRWSRPAVEQLDDRIVPSTIGVFNPQAAVWYLRNANSAGTPSAGQIQYGGANWKAVAGDWNGDSTTSVGVFNPSTETWYLRNSNSQGAPDITPFQYGQAGWTPVAGNWDGNGTTTIGVVNPTTETWYLRNSNSQGAPDVTPFTYGAPGWTPVAGDWDINGTTTIGVVNPTTETWYLRNSNTQGAPDITPFSYGGPGWTPVAGNWGATTTEPAIAVSGFSATEGNSGTSTADFNISLTEASASTITVAYATANGTATAGSDYQATSGTLTFAPGETFKTVSVTILGDTTVEGNETLTLNLSGATNATIDTPSAIGTIVGDDSAQTATLTPAAEEGPFFVDFSTAALNRSELTTGTTRASVLNGVPLALTFNVFQISGTTVTPLSGARVDVWEADAIGKYSAETSEGTASETYLRGYQATSAAGSVSFNTIIPGWYGGRTAHIHLMIRSSASGTLTNLLTTQVFFADSFINTIFANAPYNSRGTRDTTNATDHVYNGTSGGTIVGPSLTLSPTATGSGGYAATFNVYVQAS